MNPSISESANVLDIVIVCEDKNDYKLVLDIISEWALSYNEKDFIIVDDDKGVQAYARKSNNTLSMTKVKQKYQF